MLNLRKFVMTGILFICLQPLALAAPIETSTTAVVFADILTEGMLEGATEDLTTPLSDKQIQCFKEQSNDETVTAMKKTLLTVVTPAELAQVDTFLQSRLGGQVIKALHAAVKTNDVGDVLADLDLASLTPAEEMAFEKFYRSKAYRKLFEGDALGKVFDSKATMKAMTNIAVDKIVSCDIPVD